MTGPPARALVAADVEEDRHPLAARPMAWALAASSHAPLVEQVGALAARRLGASGLEARGEHAGGGVVATLFTAPGRGVAALATVQEILLSPGGALLFVATLLDAALEEATRPSLAQLVAGRRLLAILEALLEQSLRAAPAVLLRATVLDALAERLVRARLAAFLARGRPAVGEAGLQVAHRAGPAIRLRAAVVETLLEHPPRLMRAITLAGRARRLAVAQTRLEELRSSRATRGVVAALRQALFEHSARGLGAAIVARVVHLAACRTTLPQRRVGASLTGALRLTRNHAFFEDATSLRRALLFARGGRLLGSYRAGTEHKPSEHKESAVPEKAPSSHCRTSRSMVGEHYMSVQLCRQDI